MTVVESTPVARLRDTARRGELHHALILHGPSPMLLRETAIGIAKTLNCLNGELEDDCVSCSKIDRGVHPDLVVVEVSEERKMIAVEQIRELVSKASMRPYEGRTKIFVVDPAEAMSVGGANALLKTLEEPTPDTQFLLLTRSPDLLLPTIRSRSQSIHIRPVAIESAKGSRGSRQLKALAAVFPGIEPADLQENLRAILEALAEFVGGNTAALLGLATLIAAIDRGDGFAIYASVLRDLVSRDPAESEVPRAAAAVSEAIAKERLLASADVAMRAAGRLVVNVDARLLAEAAVAPLVG